MGMFDLVRLTFLQPSRTAGSNVKRCPSIVIGLLFEQQSDIVGRSFRGEKSMSPDIPGIDLGRIIGACKYQLVHST